jgi:phosphatidate cytidylyltransferase
MTLSGHQKRIITALILIPVLGLIIFTGAQAVNLALVVVSGLGLWEFYSFFWPGKEKSLFKLSGITLGTAFIFLPWTWLVKHTLLVGIISFWLLSLSFLIQFSLIQNKASYFDFLIIFAGLFYLPLALKLFTRLEAQEIILVLLATFASDTGAYYVGSWKGKRKIWPQISPKKTWLGSFGGLILCTFITLILGLIWGSKTWWAYLVLGFILNLAAQMGDFFESALKRWARVKDSGCVLPGHGGILDRIDSLLLLLPVYFISQAIYPLF